MTFRTSTFGATLSLCHYPEELGLLQRALQRVPHQVKLAISTLALAVLLQGCQTAPVEPVAIEPEEVPELTLNLPQEQDCNCVVEDPTDYTFLERGFKALADGDHIDAVQHFQRYQRLEKTAAAEWEAGIAIAYMSTLSASPFYDPEEARKSYWNLRKAYSSDLIVHDQTLIMAQSLESFDVSQRHIKDLENNHAILKADLKKREEALKRLRELTLGQKAGQQ
ncbi:MAG: hypothetical protein V7742_11800 [Halioglobus sp.]